MNSNKKGSRLIAIGILVIVALSMVYGYRTIRRISPRVDERLSELETVAKGKIEDYFGIDVDRLFGGDETQLTTDVPSKENGDETGDEAGEESGEPSSNQKTYDYTYKDQGTRKYHGPVIYQMNGLIFNTDGKQIRDFLGNKTYYLEMTKNADGSEAVLVHDNICYYIDADLNMTEIAQGVSEAGMCYNGGYFFYILEGEKYETKTYIYSVKDKRDWEVSKGHAKFAVISPNGRCVASFDYEAQPQLRIGGIDIEEITVTLDKRMSPLAVSDDGDTVFYNSLDDEDGIFCYNRNKTTKLSREYIYEGFFDRECKQILFEEPGGIRYFKAGDTSAVKLSDTSHYSYDFSGIAAAQISPFSDLYILDTDSFSDAIRIRNSEDFFCLVGKTPQMYDMIDEGTRTVSFASTISSDGPECIYASGNSLVKRRFDGKELSEEIINTNESSVSMIFACSDDLSEIWYKMGADLYYLREGSFPVRVASECGFDLKYSSYDGKCYYIRKGYLHRVGATPDSDEVVSSNCKRFKFFPGELNVVGFTDNDEKDYIVLEDLVNFEK